MKISEGLVASLLIAVFLIVFSFRETIAHSTGVSAAGLLAPTILILVLSWLLAAAWISRSRKFFEPSVPFSLDLILQVQLRKGQPSRLRTQKSPEKTRAIRLVYGQQTPDCLWYYIGPGYHSLLPAHRFTLTKQFFPDKTPGPGDIELHPSKLFEYDATVLCIRNVTCKRIPFHLCIDGEMWPLYLVGAYGSKKLVDLREP